MNIVVSHDCWRPQDSSGLRVHYSQEEAGPAPGQRTVLVSGAGTRVSCAARLVAASLHSHGGREADMRHWYLRNHSVCVNEVQSNN